MCGIAGGIGLQAPNHEVLSRALDSINHRGPDERGAFVAPGVALGICRLAIIDVSTGQQPVSDASRIFQMVFNGEIYNFKELRKILVGKGHEFRSQSDSEVVLHMYQEFGLAFVDQLKGMFAIAIWDSRDNSLILVRDHMGKKPLFYARLSDGSLMFASEVKALISAGVKVSLRKAAIAEVMEFGYVNAPLSAYAEINQIPPASIGVWRNGQVKISEYWRPDFSSANEVDYEEALEETKRVIRQAVDRRLVSERPLGSFLSGGYDSTVVTAYMAQLMQEKVKTFSIGFSDPRFDESKYARNVARHLGTEHVEEKLSPDPALLLEQLAGVLDQPFADSSIIPTFMLARFASQEVVVALGGDGGDEVFGGYDRYLAAPFMQKLNPLLVGLSPIAKSLVKRNSIKNRKVNRILSQINGNSSLAMRYRSIMSLGQRSELHGLLYNDFFATESDGSFASEFNCPNTRDDLARMTRFDIARYLPGDLLVKADRATMANSLELRSPFLDVDVVEWATRLPSAYKIKGRQTKFILKDIARSLVPPELIDRPKMGFAIPRADWLRTGLRTMSYDLLTDSTARGRGWFNPKEVERLLGEHKSGVDRDSLIWPMLMLELWARTWLDR
jgi:asparagine synthase (glutamine-hydrolysing)